jgi:membrane-associated phospholipid phosphatase
MRKHLLAGFLLALPCLSLAVPTAMAAQEISPPSDSASARIDPGPIARARGPVAVSWYHIGAGLGVIGLSSLLDEELRNGLQRHRSAGKDDLASAARRMGQPEVYATIGLGTLAAGLISGNNRITKAGERITAALIMSGLTTAALKGAIGRRRPDAGAEQYEFKPFSSRDALPSGHTAMAFALATSVADEIRSTPVTVGLYAAAATTGWSRLNDNRHWLSDVLAGAAVGVTSAKLMNGHWRVLGISAPRFLVTGDGVGVSLEF